MEETTQINGAIGRRTTSALAPVSREDRAAYEQATSKLTFTKEFFDYQQAVIADTRNTMGERFMACVRWRSHGQNCLYCVAEDGSEAWQADFARWLGVDKRRISALYHHYIGRGYLRVEGKRVYLNLTPTLDPDEKSPVRSGLFEDSEFAQWWKVQAPEDFLAYMDLLCQVKEHKKVLLRALNKFRTYRTNGDTSLYETVKTVDVNTVRPCLQEEKSFEAVEDGRTVPLPPHPNPEIVEEDRPEPQEAGTGQKELIPLIVEELRHIGQVFPKWSHVDNPEAAAKTIAEACDYDKDMVTAVFQSFAGSVRESDTNIKSAVGLLIARARRFQQSRAMGAA